MSGVVQGGGESVRVRCPLPRCSWESPESPVNHGLPNALWHAYRDPMSAYRQHWDEHRPDPIKVHSGRPATEQP